MTIKEALISVLQVSMPDGSIEKALTDNGLTSSDEYAASKAKAIDECAIELLHGLLSAPNISEGGYSISYDRNAVKERIIMLAKKHNLTEYTAIYSPAVKRRVPW
jgi:hypothetical protein